MNSEVIIVGAGVAGLSSASLSLEVGEWAAQLWDDAANDIGPWGAQPKIWQADREVEG